MTKLPLLVLVDGSSYLYRAYHALPELKSSKGQPTGAVRGVIAMLRRLIDEIKPDYMAVVFDAKGKTFRNDMYADYKANRPPMPDDLRAQIEPLHDCVKAMGLPLLSVQGVEADDVIGTLATQAPEYGLQTLISTGDKDMAQLVNEHVTLVNTMTDTRMDISGVVGKFGVGPELIVDYLTLIGDTVDNVPGIPKVGPKTAVKWLAQFGDFDAIMNNAESIKGKVGENLRESLEFLPLSRQLVTIKRDVELGVLPRDLMIAAPEKEQLLDLFQHLEFKGWLNELEQVSSAEAVVDDQVTPEPVVQDVNYQIITEQELFDDWLKRLAQAEAFAFDTETTSIDYMQAEIVGVSFAITEGEAAYVPVAHDYAGAPDQLDRDAVLAALKPLLEDRNKAIIGQNLKYDMSVLARYDISLRGIADDTMLESYVVDSNGRHNMDFLAQKYLELQTIHYEDVAGKGARQIPFNQVSVEVAGPYAAEDADITLRLHQVLTPKLRALPGVESLYRNIELPLVSVLSVVERNGVVIDADLLGQQSYELAARMQEVEMQAHDLAGEVFNMGSPKQIQVILFERMELPVLAKTPKGQPSTAESVLAELANDYPLPRLILEHRSLSKLKSTYTDKLPLQIDRDTGRVHTSYHQAVTATGRLSSSDPNLQNIPVRTEEGRRIRKAFIAPDGYKLLAADYSQIELRIMAHLSADERLLEAFAAGEDIHLATAAEVFAVGLEQVSSEQRRAAKAINFGLIYGMSAFGLAKQLGIDRTSAKEYVDTYFARYPGVQRYMERTRERAHLLGFVETLFRRRLYLPEIDAKNAARRQYAERTAINAPMQGTAADIIKRAMITVQQWLQDSDEDARLIMQVHDELVLEVAEDRVDTVCAKVVELMTSAAELAVPLVVDTGVGDNWDEAH